MTKQKRRLLLAGVILVLSLAAFIVGLLILPQTLVMQVTASGQNGTTAPKLLGLLLPLALCSIFAVLYMKEENKKMLTISLVGLLVYVFVFVFNL